MKWPEWWDWELEPTPHLGLDSENLARARPILGTKTDTETFEQALDLVVFRREITIGVRRMAGSNSIRERSVPRGSRRQS